MSTAPSHPKDDIIRYLEGSLPEPHRPELLDHLRTCPSCSDFLDFSKGFADAVASLGKESTEEEDCPDSWTLASYVEGDLDKQTERQVKAHLLYCADCAGAVRMLRQPPLKHVSANLRAAGGLIEPRQVSGGTVEKALAAGATKTKGKLAFVSPFRVSETLTDDSGVQSTVILRIEKGLRPDRVQIVIESNPVPKDWKISLFEAGQDEIANMSLARRVEVPNGIAYGFYKLEVRKGDECLAGFNFTVEPFSLSEAIETGLEYLNTKDYGRALAILDNATERYPESREAWDMLSLAEAIVSQDKETYDRELTALGVVKSAQDGEENLRNVLDERNEHVADDTASLLTTAMLNQSLLTEAIVSRIKDEKVSLPVVQAVEILKERTKSTNEMLTQLLIELASRAEQFPPLIESLRKSIDAVRREVAKDVDEKFASVGEILGRFTEAVPQKGLSLPDYGPLFHRQLGDDCWSWLGDEVQKMFVSAEGVYRYLGSLPAVNNPDFTPALLQLCRGFELLLNIKLHSSCEEIARAASRQRYADLAAATRLTPGIIAGAVQLEGSLSLTQIANLMLIGSVMQQEKTAVFGNPLATLLTASKLTDFQFIAPLTHVGLFFRNGKVHPRVDSASNFTPPEEIQILRKLIFGLDENRAASGKTLDSLRETKWPWSSIREREETLGQMFTEWRTCPGLVRILWDALKESLNP